MTSYGPESPNAPVSATERVLAYLVRGLASGTYRPGQSVNAARLCQELSLSKAPVREALHVLAGEGVLTLERNRGAVITALTDQDLIQLWELFSLTMGREVRLVAAEPLTAGDCRALCDALAEIDRCARTPGVDRLTFLRSLHEWHAVVARLCPNPFIVPSQVRRLGEFWLPYIVRRVSIERYFAQYVHNYTRICAAVVAGDGPSAEAAFQYHAAWSVALLRGDRPAADGRWTRAESTILPFLNPQRG